MELEALLAESRLSDAVRAAQEAVKAAPTDVTARGVLFTLYCFAGDLDRAGRQVDAISQNSMESAYGSLILQALLKGERCRREVFAGRGQPDFLGEDHAWARNRLEVLAGGGSPSPAELEKDRVATPGALNGDAFEDLRDGDDLIAPFLEVFVAGRYVWLHWSQIRSITSDGPSVLRHTLWLPVRVALRSGDEFEGAIPALYPGTHLSSDEGVRLGHATDWQEQSGLMRGLGRRMLFTDRADLEILALRELRFSLEAGR